VSPLEHDGGLAGANAYISHRVPLRNRGPFVGVPSPPPLDAADTLSFSIAFNCDAVFDWPAIVADVVFEAQRLEREGGWPAGDVLAGAA
jgi:hypothetical protein